MLEVPKLPHRTGPKDGVPELAFVFILAGDSFSVPRVEPVSPPCPPREVTEVVFQAYSPGITRLGVRHAFSYSNSLIGRKPLQSK